MKQFYCLLFLSLFFIKSALFAQDIKYGKATYDKTGDVGTMVTPDLTLSNTGSNTIEVFVKRFYKNLPANWTSCFCFISCHSPNEDTLRFFLAPGETATIAIGFNTDTIPGIGYVHLSVEQIGGIQKDTLQFSGSTLVSGIKENELKNSFTSFPNPVVESLTFSTNSNESYILSVSDMTGKLILETEIIHAKCSFIDMKNIPAGQYSLGATFQSGKKETQKIIKN
jgi:hypothetical protein